MVLISVQSLWLTIAGTLAYMAPEQTGRMNRSIDLRSDLYSFGVTLYEMLTGALPFMASDPIEWVHCHIAKKPQSPAERVKAVPEVLSAIVMKLLAKTAEERYQTAASVESQTRPNFGVLLDPPTRGSWRTRCGRGSRAPTGPRRRARRSLRTSAATCGHV